MRSANKLYTANGSSYVLIKVQFDGSTSTYTYAAHIKYRVAKGDTVVVPTGDVMKHLNNLHRSSALVNVVDVTDDMRHLDTIEYDVSPIITKVNTKVFLTTMKAINELTE